MKKYQNLLAVILFSLASVVFAQNLITPVQSLGYQLAAVNSSGIAGIVYLADYGPGNTLIVVDMINADISASYPAHIHLGNCGGNGDVVVPLQNITGGLSITMTDAVYADIVSGDHYVNIHRPEDLSNIVACGEVGVAANSQAGLEQGSQLPTGVKAEEFAESVRTEGYGIFAVNNSGISGQVQIAEESTGNARVVVTLKNIQRGQKYGAEIFQGDCGPDRPSLVKLLPVPSMSDDPTASWTETTLTYEELAESNNFVYIYNPDGSVAACGEVGVGALKQ